MHCTISLFTRYTQSKYVWPRPVYCNGPMSSANMSNEREYSSNMCPISHHLQSKYNAKSLTSKFKGKVKQLKMFLIVRHRLQIFAMILITLAVVSTWPNIVYAKVNSYARTRTRTNTPMKDNSNRNSRFSGISILNVCNNLHEATWH